VPIRTHSLSSSSSRCVGRSPLRVCVRVCVCVCERGLQENYFMAIDYNVINAPPELQRYSGSSRCARVRSSKKSGFPDITRMRVAEKHVENFPGRRSRSCDRSENRGRPRAVFTAVSDFIIARGSSCNGKGLSHESVYSKTDDSINAPARCTISARLRTTRANVEFSRDTRGRRERRRIVLGRTSG